MRAEIRRLHSPDVDLQTWSPPEGDFAVLVQVMVGPIGEPGEESFDVTVCNAGWLATRAKRERVVDCRHTVVVDEFNYEVLSKFLAKRVSVCDGPNWEMIAEQLGRLGHWEFEDYETYSGPK